MLLGIAACALFYFLPAPESLSRCAEAAGSDGATAMRVLGAVVLAIIWWVGEVFPHWMTTITMLLLWVMLGKMPFSTAFASYTGSTVWLIIGAFCLAKAVTNTGLFNRITLGLIPQRRVGKLAFRKAPGGAANDLGKGSFQILVLFHGSLLGKV